ncbi:ABC transporter substrate-binding protein [Faecalicatena orotica]|nr:ABC transporter substrate-binding protein [Faecalicatena orotica]
MKKLVAVLLAGVMCVSLAACGGKKEEAADTTVAETTETTDKAATEDTEDAAATDGTFTTVADGVLTMGTNAAFPPYEYKEGDEVVGIDAEIAQALADKLGLKLEILDMDFSSLITAIQAGKIDISLAGMTVTDERKQNVDFTDSYATGVQVIIVKNDSDIKSVDDLANDKIMGVQEGTTGHLYCSDDYGEDHVIAYTNGATAVQALLQDKVDCVVIDQQPAEEFVEANEGLKILDTEYVVEDYAAAVSKDNPGLTAALNQALQELKDDGTIQSILDRYIKAE